MTNKKRTPLDVLLIMAFYVASCSVWMLSDISIADGGDSRSKRYVLVAFILLMIVGIVFTRNYRRNGKIATGLNRNLILYYFVVFVHICFFRSSFVSLIYALFPGVILYFLLCKKIGNLPEKEHTIIAWQTILLLLFLLIFALEIISNAGYRNDSKSAVYFIISAFPSAFLLKKGRLRVLLIILCGVTSALSMKLGVLLSYLVGLTVALLVYKNKPGNHSKRLNRATNLLVGIVLLIAVFCILNTANLLPIKFSWQEKISDSFSTEGSGRADIWRATFIAQKDSSFFQWIFGHGHNTFKIAVNQIAHNDFLGILYEYGIIALWAYIGIFVELIRIFFRLCRSNSDYAPALGAAIGAMLVMANVSYLIIISGERFLVHAPTIAVCIASLFRNDAERIQREKTNIS